MVNSQYRKSCVAFIVRKQEYVLLLAFIQKQNGSSFQSGAVRQCELSWLKQFIFSDKHSFSIRAFLLRFRSFFRWRSSFSLRRASRAISFSSGILSQKSFKIGLCGAWIYENYIPFDFWFAIAAGLSGQSIFLLMERIIVVVVVVGGAGSPRSLSLNIF